jgi:hypothetical protein
MSTLAAAADYMHGKLQGADHPFNGVSTDTRHSDSSVPPGGSSCRQSWWE